MTDIPLASYFKITRYQYNDGLKNARESGQNDASTGLSNIAPITNKIKQGNEFLFGGTDGGTTEGDQRMEALNNELRALAIADVKRGTGRSGKAKANKRKKPIKTKNLTNSEAL